MASRAWYVQQIRRDHQGQEGWELAELDAGFDLFAAPGQPFIDAARVQQDITVLEAVIRRVNAYTTKAIAHRDDILQAVHATSTPAVTWAELDAALDAVGNIHRKYYRLCHPGEALGGLTPLISPGWIQMFDTQALRPVPKSFGYRTVTRLRQVGTPSCTFPIPCASLS